jgi:hypothetical protein
MNWPVPSLSIMYMYLTSAARHVTGGDLGTASDWISALRINWNWNSVFPRNVSTYLQVRRCYNPAERCRHTHTHDLKLLNGPTVTLKNIENQKPGNVAQWQEVMNTEIAPLTKLQWMGCYHWVKEREIWKCMLRHTNKEIIGKSVWSFLTKVRDWTDINSLIV